MRKLCQNMGLLSLTLGASVLCLGCPPTPVALEPGTDCWVTQEGTQQRLNTLPAQFFGEDNGEHSNPVINPLIELEGLPLSPQVVTDVCGCPEQVDYEITWLDRHGSTVSADSKHAVTQVTTPETSVDTCIRRTVAANVQNQGVAQRVDIELVKLSLKSVTPLEVTYGQGKPSTHTSKFFDVFITESGTQRAGSMTFTTNSVSNGRANGATALGNLHIDYDAEFREVGGPATFSRTGLTLTFSGTAGNFVK